MFGLHCDPGACWVWASIAILVHVVVFSGFLRKLHKSFPFPWLRLSQLSKHEGVTFPQSEWFCLGCPFKKIYLKACPRSSFTEYKVSLEDSEAFYSTLAPPSGVIAWAVLFSPCCTNESSHQEMFPSALYCSKKIAGLFITHSMDVAVEKWFKWNHLQRDLHRRGSTRGFPTLQTNPSCVYPMILSSVAFQWPLFRFLWAVLC